MSEQELCLVSVRDGFGGIVEVYLSIEDVKRCETDMVFVQSMIDSSRADDKPPNSDQKPNSNDSLNNLFRWSNASILLPVEGYRKFEVDFATGKLSQKKGWEKISEILCENGHTVSGPQCLSKLNGMKRTYKTIRYHNSKYGNNPRSWPYLVLMESLMGERPFMEPPALASSSCGNLKIQMSVQNSNNCTESPTTSRVRARKRPATEEVSSIARAILESRRIAEENKNKRHKENYKQRALIIEKLDALLDKL